MPRRGIYVPVEKRKCLFKYKWTGKMFGAWKVLGPAPRKNKGGFWRCECTKCGTQRTIYYRDLKFGKTRQCLACRRKVENITGRRFFKWTVLGILEDGRTTPRWRCRCDCGRESAVTRRDLVRGLSRQCRSCFKQRNHERPRGRGSKFGSFDVVEKEFDPA